MEHQTQCNESAFLHSIPLLFAPTRKEDPFWGMVPLVWFFIPCGWKRDGLYVAMSHFGVLVGQTPSLNPNALAWRIMWQPRRWQVALFCLWWSFFLGNWNTDSHNTNNCRVQARVHIGSRLIQIGFNQHLFWTVRGFEFCKCFALCRQMMFFGFSNYANFEIWNSIPVQFKTNAG